MAINYNRMREVFVRLVSENGRDVVIVNKGIGGHDPVTGTVTSTPTQVNALAVFPTITEKNREGLSIGEGEKIVFITEKVEKDDLIQDGGQDWQITDVADYYPGDVEIGWKCAVRK